MNKRFFGGFVASVLAGLLVLAACNKSVQNDLGGDGGADTTAVKNKVLFIMIDGAVGDEVRKIQAPTLVNMADNAIFSWDALSDFDNNTSGNYLTWANILTGTESSKHKVTGNSFASNNFSQYPSVFTRLKQSRPDLKTAAFTASKVLSDNLAADAAVKQSFENNDVAVKNAAMAELSSNSASDLVLVQFHNVETVGTASGYLASNTAYRNAVLEVDNHIKEMMASIAARPSYAKENWLIMVVSNKGNNTPFVPGPGEIWSAFKDGRHNTMFLAYNFTPIPNFRIQNTAKPTVIPYLGTSTYYSGTRSQNKRARMIGNNEVGNIGATGSYTIQCKVRLPQVNVNYPAILSKRATFSGGVVGWVFFLEGGRWQINFGQSGFGNIQLGGTTISDNDWHTLTAQITQVDANTRTVYVFTDGQRSAGNINIAGRGNLDSPSPLTFGNNDNDNNTGLTNYLVTDVRIYNTALPDDYIQANYCRTDVADDEYKDNLLGFWPSNNIGPDKIIADESGNGNDLLVQTFDPAIFNDISTKVCPPIVPAVYRSVPNSVDVAMQVYQWLGVLTPPSWGLDGKTWLPQYINVR
ncbi:alkaline phosphatase family protein [Niabella insulamsoli]|uniref:alkaline phosphatase family protein n=1 Tax=Niabella insulamsoli TaxID=3144874 RepID=UPI0031FD7B01